MDTEFHWRSKTGPHKHTEDGDACLCLPRKGPCPLHFCQRTKLELSDHHIWKTEDLLHLALTGLAANPVYATPTARNSSLP